jgi:hypothetical protein
MIDYTKIIKYERLFVKNKSKIPLNLSKPLYINNL